MAKRFDNRNNELSGTHFIYIKIGTTISHLFWLKKTVEKYFFEELKENYQWINTKQLLAHYMTQANGLLSKTIYFPILLTVA